MEIIKNPGAIATKSMEIIDQELPELQKLPAGERAVVKRIVHTTGDPSIARLIRIHPLAVEAGVNALKQGKLIYTDVNMVRVGISPEKTKALGIDVICPIRDPQVMTASLQKGETRAMLAIEHYYNCLQGAVVAIGNAPTALFKLLELIKIRGCPPALIIGVPVGFVGASESKELLPKSNIPYITVTGTRGGSPLAVAAVNALLNLI